MKILANLLKKTGEVLNFRGHYRPSASALSESLSIHLKSGKDWFKILNNFDINQLKMTKLYNIFS